MNLLLKNAIIAKTQDNLNEFQLSNYIHDSFREYIYDSKGEYLIGGKEVSDFIKQTINLFTI